MENGEPPPLPPDSTPHPRSHTHPPRQVGVVGSPEIVQKPPLEGEQDVRAIAAAVLAGEVTQHAASKPEQHDVRAMVAVMLLAEGADMALAEPRHELVSGAGAQVLTQELTPVSVQAASQAAPFQTPGAIFTAPSPAVASVQGAGLAADVPAALLHPAQPALTQPPHAQPLATQLPPVPTSAQPPLPQPLIAQPRPSQPTAVQPFLAQSSTAQPISVQPTLTQPPHAQPPTVQPTSAQPTTSHSKEAWGVGAAVVGAVGMDAGVALVAIGRAGRELSCTSPDAPPGALSETLFGTLPDTLRHTVLHTAWRIGGA